MASRSRGKKCSKMKSAHSSNRSGRTCSRTRPSAVRPFIFSHLGRSEFNRTDRTGRKLNDEWPVSRACVSHPLCLKASLPLVGFRRKLHFLFLVFQSNLYVIHLINHKTFTDFHSSDDAIYRANEKSNWKSSAIIKSRESLAGNWSLHRPEAGYISGRSSHFISISWLA